MLQPSAEIRQYRFFPCHVWFASWCLCFLSLVFVHAAVCLHRVCRRLVRGRLPAAVWMWEWRPVWQTDRTVQLQRRLGRRALWERWGGQSVPAQQPTDAVTSRCTVETARLAIMCVFVNYNFQFAPSLLSMRTRPVWRRLRGEMSVCARGLMSPRHWTVSVSSRLERKTDRKSVV